MTGESGFTLDELKSVYRGDERGLREILLIFRQDAPSRIEELDTALREKDLPKAAKAAHGVANLLSALRNHDGVAAARATERALNERDLSEAEARAAVCRQEVEAALRRTDEELS